MDATVRPVPVPEPVLEAGGFSRAFPFYIQLDAQLHIVRLGPSMQKVVGPAAYNAPLNQVFTVTRPVNMGSYEDIQRNIGEMLTLVSRMGNTITFRGSPEQGEGNTLLLLLSPVLQSLTEQDNAKLYFSDFAKHDASADAMLLAQTTRMSALDAERSAKSLRHRGEQLNSILELSNHGIVFFDSHQFVLHVNSVLLDMLGLERADVLTMCLQQLDARLQDLHDKDAGESTSLARMRAGDNASNLRSVMHLTRPCPRDILVECAHSPDGGTVYYLRDITQETEVDRMKSDFLAAAAHELRTPMVSVLGFTELLLHRQFTEERRTEMLQTIHRQSGLLVKMINELLDLARIESRRGLDLNIQAHSVRDLIEMSVSGLMRADTDRQVSVGTVPDARVLIDPEKMQMAMGNLLSNAFKYSPQGGAVTLQTRIDTVAAESFAVIEITDQGIGMSPAELDRAFERFYRADASGSIPGTGLGLSMVKEIAELHNGKIVLSSEKGAGTVAILWIPLETPFLAEAHLERKLRLTKENL